MQYMVLEALVALALTVLAEFGFVVASGRLAIPHMRVSAALERLNRQLAELSSCAARPFFPPDDRRRFN